MQKTLLTFVIIVWHISLFGQISIVKGDMPVPGYVARISSPDTILQLDPHPTGTNFSWDFSQMTAVSQRTDSFISPNAVPLTIRLQFPFGVTVVKVQETPDSLGGVSLGEGYEVFEANNQAYEYLGLAGTVSGLPLVLENNPPDVVYAFPLAYGNQDSSFAIAELNIPGFAFIRREVKRVNLVDGWGQLASPYGSFNCLRIQSTLTEFDSLVYDTISVSFDRPTTKEYKWLGKEERVPLLQINTMIANNLEVTTQVSYVDSLRNFSTTGISHFEPLGTKLYPNPALDRISIELEEFPGEPAEMEIFNMTGQRIADFRITQASQLISLPMLSAGVYLVKIHQAGRHYYGRLVISQDK